ncbi:FHA domain-containing protein [Candidatus Chlorohelix sp.]|uniref:FHA domain-containing protein n=1 Tax=Candidatus Chlorohelix sp. TaxID=3139201 RepID=UPI00304B2242
MSQPVVVNREGQKLKISFVTGPRTGERLSLPYPEQGISTILMGRSRECPIWIDSADVSRRHAEIIAGQHGQLLIHDLGSINGTLVNGQIAQLTAPLPLHPGDHIKLGLTEILFEGVTGVPTPRSKSTPTVTTRPTTPLSEDLFIYIFLRDGQLYLFSGEEATIGRGQANDIVIDNNSMSRQHARLVRTPTGVYISDLGSTNKTFVNGVQADAPILIHDGDVLRFGDVVADFKIENQRLSAVFKAEEPNIPEIDSGTKFDKTFLGDMTVQEVVQNSPDDMRRSIEEGETNLAVNLIVVGRNQRQSSAALPESSAANRTEVARPALPQARFGSEVARLEGVWYTEGSGRAATLLLKDVRIGLRQGELVALVGPSGSGKSEIVEIMGGFLAADRGMVSILGYQIPTHENWRGKKRLNLEEERDHVRWRSRNIGYMNSDLNQLNPRLTILEQITSAIELAGTVVDPRRRNEIAMERLYLVGLSDPEISRLKPSDLNRREKQLVALARALANDPPILLGDEPIGNLSSEAANYVFKLLQQFVASGKTVLMVTHDAYWARNATRQIEILDGEIVGSLS